MNFIAESIFMDANKIDFLINKAEANVPYIYLHSMPFSKHKSHYVILVYSGSKQINNYQHEYVFEKVYDYRNVIKLNNLAYIH